MPNDPHFHPRYTLRLPEELMDKLKYIAGRNGRSANKEIEQLVLRYVAAYEKKYGELILDEEDYKFIDKRNIPKKSDE